VGEHNWQVVSALGGIGEVVLVGAVDQRDAGMIDSKFGLRGFGECVELLAVAGSDPFEEARSRPIEWSSFSLLRLCQHSVWGWFPMVRASDNQRAARIQCDRPTS
jgi:hypothetical protein